MARDHLGNLNTHRSVGSDVMLRELAEVMAMKGRGEKERCLRAGGELLWLQSSKRARRGTQVTIDQSASPPSLER